MIVAGKIGDEKSSKSKVTELSMSIRTDLARAGTPF